MVTKYKLIFFVRNETIENSVKKKKEVEKFNESAFFHFWIFGAIVNYLKNIDEFGKVYWIHFLLENSLFLRLEYISKTLLELENKIYGVAMIFHFNN